MAETRIQLCGRIRARIAGRRVDADLPGRQGVLLFAFLTIRRAMRTDREQAIEAIWPQGAPQAADAALSALLSKLRAALAPARIEGRGVLHLELPADAFVDIEAAAEALHRAESAVSRRDWAAAWGPSRVALHTAARGFLPGHEAPWIDEQRHGLEEMELRAHECVAEAGLGMGGGELAAAERSGRRLVERAPYRESGYRWLIEALARRDNLAEALRVYDRLRCLLRDELGIPPGEEMQELHARLLAGRSA